MNRADKSRWERGGRNHHPPSRQAKQWAWWDDCADSLIRSRVDDRYVWTIEQLSHTLNRTRTEVRARREQLEQEYQA